MKRKEDRRQTGRWVRGLTKHVTSNPDQLRVNRKVAREPLSAQRSNREPNFGTHEPNYTVDVVQ